MVDLLHMAPYEYINWWRRRWNKRHSIDFETLQEVEFGTAQSNVYHLDDIFLHF